MKWDAAASHFLCRIPDVDLNVGQLTVGNRRWWSGKAAFLSARFTAVNGQSRGWPGRRCRIFLPFTFLKSGHAETGKLKSCLQCCTWAISPKFMFAQLFAGVELDAGLSQIQICFSVCGAGVNHWYRVIIKQFRKRVTWRLFDPFGFTVSPAHPHPFRPDSPPLQLRRGQKIELEEDLVARVLE